MKISKNFVIREIAGDYVLIPTGEMALKFSGFITTNEVGVLIWKLLEEEKVKEEIVNKIAEEFEVTRQDADKDFDEFIDQLIQLNILEL